MTQGQLEQLPLGIEKIFGQLEMQIMTDIINRIRENGFSTATADWEITRLQQLGKSEGDIRKWIQEALKASDEEISRIFSEEVYREYMGHERAYQLYGLEQVPYKDNTVLQALVEAARTQTEDTFKNITSSMGFAVRGPSGTIAYSPLMDFYRSTLDIALMGIQTGAFSYQTMLERTISRLTSSGVRWIDYDSGHHNRIDVAARRAVMTGFRQVQGRINEQTAAALGTDSYEVTFHVGARPSHQPWQGRVWTMAQLRSVCGLGSVTGLHGANCYHDYNAFIPGVSERVYTDAWLDEQIQKENTPRTYNGKEYTTYEALQHQRKMEAAMRKSRQDIRLLEEGKSENDIIIQKRAKYQGQLQEYQDFSKRMGLPLQMDRVYQDGLKGSFLPKKADLKRLEQKQRDDKIKAEIKSIGMKGKIELSPKNRINTSDFSFDDKHINTERMHKVSRDEAERFIREADISFTRWEARFVNYYGPNGAVFLDVEKKNIRTAFRKDEYDPRVQKMREVLEQNGND